MAGDWQSVSRLDLPYKNLVISGFLGVGKSTVGRRIARVLELDLLDVDEEIELQELMSIAKIRELYGDSRLKTLEHEQCRTAALMRRAVIVVPGAALLDERNASILSQSGLIVVLTCELGEALRRMHQGSEQHYRDKIIRRRMLSRLRREYAVVEDPGLLQLDTTHLSIEEEAQILVDTWLTGEPLSEHFRYGPPPRITPPKKPPIGLSARMTPKPSESLEPD